MDRVSRHVSRADLSRVVDKRPLLPIQRGLAFSATFDVDGLTLNAGAISAARNRASDGSGGLSQSTGVNQPLVVPFVRGARVAARFDGSNDVLTGGTLTTAIQVPFDFLAVAKITTDRNYGRIFGQAASLGLDCDAAGNIYLFNGSVGTFATNDGRWHVYSGRFNGAASFGAVDRGRVVTVSPGTTATSMTAVSVGGAASANLAGEVGEVHVFSRMLQDVERRACIDVLMARWGLR